MSGIGLKCNCPMICANYILFPVNRYRNLNFVYTILLEGYSYFIHVCYLCFHTHISTYTPTHITHHTHTHQNLGSKHIDLILEYSKWVIKVTMVTNHCNCEIYTCM